jgi:hypothetical protein
MSLPQHSTKNFVAPHPDTPKPQPAAQITVLPRADTLLTRQDVMSAHRALLQAYEQQQSDIADGWGDGSGWAAPSRPTAAPSPTGMYLGATVALTAITTGGISLIAWLAGAGPAWAVAGWVAGTGAVALVLCRRQHADELRHSQIGLARLVAEHSYDLLAAAQDGHLALLAEERADARAVRAAQDARAAAAAAAWLPQPPQAAQPAPQPPQPAPQHPQPQHRHPQPAQATATAEPDDDIPDWIRRRPQQTAQAAPQAAAQAMAAQAAPQPEPQRPAWAEALLSWAATVHDGGLGADGLIVRATPWAARSPWPAPAKAAMLALLTAQPAIITPSGDGRGGGRYRLDVAAAPTAAALAALVAVRIDTVGAP